MHSPSSSRDKAVNNSPSLFADLFRRDSRKVPLGGVGAHHVLSTTDGDGDVVPLEDLDTPSVDRFSTPPTPEPENPFDTPSASRTSLNIPDNPAIMTESDSAPTELSTSPAAKNHLDVPKRPTLEASSSFAGPEAEAGGDGKVKRTKSKRQPPPPKPLDLPAPKVPPPHPDAPHTARPPEPVAEPELDVHERDRDVEAGRREAKPVEDLPPMRWWHEWLCGCGEGPDRGGDNQVRGTYTAPLILRDAHSSYRPGARIHLNESGIVILFRLPLSSSSSSSLSRSSDAALYSSSFLPFMFVRHGHSLHKLYPPSSVPLFHDHDRSRTQTLFLVFTAPSLLDVASAVQDHGRIM